MRNRGLKLVLILASVFVALYVRSILIDASNNDLRDYSAWYDFIVAHGQIRAFSSHFYSYSPPFIYLISLVSLFSWIPKIAAIKLISILFDFSAAIAVYKIINYFSGNEIKAFFGFCTALLLPTVIAVSSIWGQSDVIYTSFLLWMVYALLSKRNIAALVLFSIAIAFKLQAIFVAPLILILFITKKIEWKWIFILPVINFLAFVPALLAGCPFKDLLFTYPNQATNFSSLSMNAPNPYILLAGDAHYSMRAVLLGVAFAGFCTLIYMIFRFQKDKYIPSDFYIYDATLLSMILPFVLPKMSERYFFLAAFLLFIIAFKNKRFLVPAILIQASSILSYISFARLIPIDTTVIAFFINCIVVFLVIVEYFREINFRILSRAAA